MILNTIRELPVIGILRGICEEQLEPLTESIIASGLKVVEITMNTGHASSLISKMNAIAGDRLTIGAGTVLKTSELFDALDSGAKFIVSPSIVEEVIEFCYMNQIPVFPGALSPTEIFRAWNLGATMVKLFPASLFGPGYIREVKAPLNNIEIMATGGISTSNLAEYFTMGASAVAFGASIFKKEDLETGNYHRITQGISDLISEYHAWNKTNHKD